MRVHPVANWLRWIIVLAPTAALAQFGATPLAPPPQPAGPPGAREGVALGDQARVSRRITSACAGKRRTSSERDGITKWAKSKPGATVQPHNA